MFSVVKNESQSKKETLFTQKTLLPKFLHHILFTYLTTDYAMNPSLDDTVVYCHSIINPLMPSGNEKVTHTQTKLQLSDFTRH